MVNIPLLIIGLVTVAIVFFVVGVNIKYYNKTTLKFAADNELHISEVKISYRNIFEN